jgi:hypothetical protein
VDNDRERMHGENGTRNNYHKKWQDEGRATRYKLEEGKKRCFIYE